MELNRAVGENIKRIRKSKKLSMERTAELSGVSRSMLGQIERGEANPSVAILGRLAKALKVPAELLLENDDFEALLEVKEMDTKPQRLDGGKVVFLLIEGVTGHASPTTSAHGWKAIFWTFTSAPTTRRSLPSPGACVTPR